MLLVSVVIIKVFFWKKCRRQGSVTIEGDGVFDNPGYEGDDANPARYGQFHNEK